MVSLQLKPLILTYGENVRRSESNSINDSIRRTDLCTLRCADVSFRLIPLLRVYSRKKRERERERKKERILIAGLISTSQSPASARARDESAFDEIPK